jgi:aminodeoxyfutalosine deaminase
VLAMSMRIDPWIAELPKVELHVHLEGSMTPTTVGRLAARHKIDTSGIWPDGLPDAFSFDGFPDFARQFQFGLRLLRTGEDIEDIIVALAADLARQNVRYAEVTSTVFTHLTAGLSAADYGTALNDGHRRAIDAHGVTMAWVIDVPRDLEQPDSTVTIDFLASRHAPDATVAIGLGGYEVGCPPEPYVSVFERARALGLVSLPHAGETEGPASIIGALDALGAQRIGHGVRCLEDIDLVARLRDEAIALEVCPTSNVLLGVAPSLAEHPIAELIAAGLTVSINTDDPGMFATDLNTELQIVHDHHGVSRSDLVALQLSALEASLLAGPQRRSIEAELRAYS